MKKNTIYMAMISMFFLTSCDIVDQEIKPETYGLPNYELEVDGDDYSIFDANEFSNLYIKGALKVEGQKYNITIRHQGNTTRGLFKKNYLMQFDGQDPNIQCNSVVLSGQQKDRSMLRAYLSYYLFNQAGLKTSSIKPITFYINGSAKGLYFLIEPINEEFFAKRGSSSSELYKAINTLGYLSFNNNKEIRDGFDKKSPDDDNYSTLTYLISFVDNNSGDAFKEKIEKYFDVDAYLRYMAVSQLICNYDGIFHNYYLNREAGTSRFEIIPWDMDLTFSFESIICAFPGTGAMMDKLMQYQDYRNKFKEYLTNYLNSSFAVDNMVKKIEETKELIADAYANDPYFNSNSDDLNKEAEIIKNYVIARNNYLREKLSGFN